MYNFFTNNVDMRSRSLKLSFCNKLVLQSSNFL